MRDSVHYKHDVKVYVPCFFSENSFKYSLADANEDLQMVLSMEPDYVLILSGKFDAKTQPYDEEITNYNFKNLEDEG